MKRSLGAAATGLVAGMALWSGAALAQQLSSPLPETLSPAGRAAVIEAAKQPQASDTDTAARRAFISKYQDDFGAKQRRRYAVDMSLETLAGVPVRIITPQGKPAKGGLVLLNLHGGGFNADSGSQTENIPIAALTGIPVVAVIYRLAPEHLFPAAIDDGLAVYKALLKTHKPSQIGIYGTSAGAIYGPQLLARIHKEGLPEPAVFGMFAGDADPSRQGDTMHYLGMNIAPYYKLLAGKTAVTDPAFSVALGPVDFFPPTLCLSSTRDFYMSSTANFCRQLELAGVQNKLVVFDGLPHAFWSYLETPESDQAFGVMARFMTERLTGQERR